MSSLPSTRRVCWLMGSTLILFVRKGIGFDFKIAAKKGHCLSMANVGAMYMDGDGIGRDYVKARKWLKRAVAQGDAIAAHVSESYDHAVNHRHRLTDLHHNHASDQ